MDGNMVRRARRDIDPVRLANEWPGTLAALSEFQVQFKPKPTVADGNSVWLAFLVVLGVAGAVALVVAVWRRQLTVVLRRSSDALLVLGGLLAVAGYGVLALGVASGLGLILVVMAFLLAGLGLVSSLSSAVLGVLARRSVVLVLALAAAAANAGVIAIYQRLDDDEPKVTPAELRTASRPSGGPVEVAQAALSAVLSSTRADRVPACVALLKELQADCRPDRAYASGPAALVWQTDEFALVRFPTVTGSEGELVPLERADGQWRLRALPGDDVDSCFTNRAALGRDPSSCF